MATFPPGTVVAFAFLTHSGVRNSAVWDEFFRGCAEPVARYVYNHARDGNGIDLRFTATMVHIMARITVACLNATWVQFVSDSCIPVQTCPEYMARLRESDSTFITTPKSSQWVTIRADQLRSNVPRFARHVAQFSGLTGDSNGCHGDAKRGTEIWVPPTWGAFDEYALAEYWSTYALAHKNDTLTYVRWEHEKNGHPDAFGKSNWRKHLSDARNSGFYFMRKIKVGLAASDWRLAMIEDSIKRQLPGKAAFYKNSKLKV